MKDQLYKIVTAIAIISYFVPILIVLFKRLWKDQYFLLIALYWLAGAVINIFGFIPGISSSSREVMIVIYNMLDIPVILSILWFATNSVQLRKLLRLVIAGYIVTELALVFAMGVNYNAIKYILGLGVLLVLVTIVWEITLYLKQIEHSNREKSMLFIYAALLFEYGSYVIVYIFEYFIIQPDAVDTMLIYYFSAVIAIMIATFGLLIKKSQKSVA